MAIATDGVVYVNAITFTVRDDLTSIIATAQASGRPVFVGIALTKAEAKAALPHVDDAAAEIAARVCPKLARASR